jgi:short-subunit dehydrogenase
MEKPVYTMITGASSGIGKAMAWYCGSLGMNLILVSLPGEGLKMVAEAISQKYGVKTCFYETDLSALNAPGDLFEFTQDRQLDVSILVNNAGVAGASVFGQSDFKYIDDRILLNIRAVVMLTRLYLPVLSTHPVSHILNVGSMAGFFKIPYKSLYCSSKAFVYTFSRSVQSEVKGLGVNVSIVCPNGVRTNATTNLRINSHGRVGRLTEISAEIVAKKAIDGMLRNKFLIVPGKINYLLLLLQKLIPGPVQQKLLMKEFDKEVRATAKTVV